MSLLLDALKKAAEKNAKNGESVADDSTKIDLSEASEKTVIADKTEVSSDKPLVDFQQEPSTENITEMELAQIINASKEKSQSLEESLEDSLIEAKQDAEKMDDADQLFANLDLNENVDPDPSLALLDEDPSLKLAISDEEILLTDDDVTEFLGGDELQTRLDEDGTLTGSDHFIDGLDDETELKLADKTATRSLNLVEPSSMLALEDNDTTYRREDTSTALNAGQTTNLNSLTNDVTISVQDQTSTETFASDNYDRTLVKLDEDVSKVFTGMKAASSGAAMTPDFAKKVFIHKSTTLRRRNYKIYTLISIFLLFVIGVLALFDMQSQVDDIDSSLARLKRNPVPSELRFKRQEKQKDDKGVLQGKVDTEALKLLKSMVDKADNTNEQVTTSENENMTTDKVDNQVVSEKSMVDEKTPVVKQTDKVALEKETELVAKVGIIADKPAEKQNTKTPVAKVKVARSGKTAKKTNSKTLKGSKDAIKIKTKVAESKKSIWLNEAYHAFEKGDIDLAAMNYSRVLKKDPTNRDALLGQAAIFSAQNKNNQAIANYQAILLENPKDSLAMTSLITASTMTPIESESRLKLLLRESPNATFLQFALGNVISAQNRWQEAQKYYFMAYQSEPKNPDYAYNLAVSLEQINKPEVAINYYEQAVNNAIERAASFDVALIKQRIEVLSQ